MYLSTSSASSLLFLTQSCVEPQRPSPSHCPSPLALPHRVGSQGPPTKYLHFPGRRPHLGRAQAGHPAALLGDRTQEAFKSEKMLYVCVLYTVQEAPI